MTWKKGMWLGCLILVAALIVACAVTPDSKSADLAIVQLNDVYEMEPMGPDGGYGGLARVATLRRDLLEETPNVFTVLAGDVLSPSALGHAVVDGEKLSGKQMVAACNALGMDYMAFGNHEFDLKREDFYKRLQESQFTWLAANVADENGQPFPNSPAHAVRKIESGGREIGVGFFGVTIDKNKKDYVTYNSDYVAVAKAQVRALRDKGADIIVAITHLSLEDDRKLAAVVPEIDLVLGGHEHENYQVLSGADLTPVYKADANARTVYIHRLRFDADKNELSVTSELKLVDRSIADEPDTAAVVARWRKAAFDSFRADGVEPTEPIAVAKVELDGLEASVRNRETELTRIIARGMATAVDGAELSVYNGGSIRIDDAIPAGSPIRRYDVMRVLPFGGDVVLAKVRGDKLQAVLTRGAGLSGTGGFLHTANVAQGEDKQWLVNGEPLDPARVYLVATSDYLFKDDEEGFDLGKAEEGNPNFALKGLDVQTALSNQLKAEFE